MPYDETGYLSEDISSIMDLIRKKYKKLFNLVIEVNAISHKIKNIATIKSNDLREIVNSCLLIRMIDSYQSIYFLCEKGLTVDASIILRMMLESLIIFNYVAKNKENLEKYINADLVIRIKKWKSIKNNELGIYDDIHEKVNPGVLQEICEIVKVEGIKKSSIREMANTIGLGHIYELVYRSLCDETHVSPRSLEKYVIMKEGNIIAIDGTPKIKEIEPVIVMSSLALLTAIVEYKKQFDIDDSGAVERLYKKVINWGKRCTDR